MPKKGRRTLEQRRKSVFKNPTTDPERVFEILQKDYVGAVRHRAKVSSGLEWLVTNMMPSVVSHLALMADPLRDFRITTSPISKANRFREFDTPGSRDEAFVGFGPLRGGLRRNWILDDPYFTKKEYLFSSWENPIEVSPFDPVFFERSSISDTSSRTRRPGSEFGEFEKFLYTYQTVHRDEIYASRVDKVWRPDINPLFYDYGWRTDYFTSRGQASAVWTEDPVLSPREDMKDYALNMLAENVLHMLPECLQDRRLFNGFYQIAELKDTHLLIQQLKSCSKILLGLMENGFGDHLLSNMDKIFADQHLGYQFGWKSYLQSIMGFLTLPSKCAKRMNYLIERNNRTITGRSKRTFHLDPLLSSTPTWEYFTTDAVTLDSESDKLEFDVEIRLAVNQTVRFPTCSVPSLRDSNFRDLMGLNPTVSDLYNLIPWSWLVDWFSDIGDYIHVMDSINRDRSLINYGFATFVSTERLTHEYVLSAHNGYFEWSSPDDVAPYLSEDRVVKYPGKEIYERKYQLRVDISDLAKVKALWNLPSLDDFQRSILGALITKYA